LPYIVPALDPCVDDAWTTLQAAGASVGDWPEIVWADADGDDLSEGWALRLLVEARCANPAVEAAWAANEARCDGLGWGEDWAVLCASLSTLSGPARSVVDTWNGGAIKLEPCVAADDSPLAGNGELDGDGLSSLEEFTALGGARGSARAFAEAASGD